MDESTVRETLEEERAAALLRITAVTSEFDGIVEDSQYANADDEHDPEGSTIAYERSRVAALIAGEKSHLDDLDRAMARLSSGNYGLCEGCGGQISAERLAALPAVRTCIACAVSPRTG